jgi:DNA-binding NarL/FixJ family response regulator
VTDEPMANRVRVLVVDDQQLIREGIASLLSIQPGITVVGTAADGADAIEQTVALGLGAPFQVRGRMC